MAAPVGLKKVHRYTVEFKIQAVRLSLHPEIQTQDVARALDIHPFMLSKWKKDYREGRLELAESVGHAQAGSGEAGAAAAGKEARRQG
jgi:transposase-like protein